MDKIPKYLVFLSRDNEFKEYFSNYVNSLGKDFENKFEYYLRKNCKPFGKVCHTQFLTEKIKIVNNFSYIYNNLNKVIEILNKKDFENNLESIISVKNDGYLNLINKFLYIRADNENIFNLIPKDIRVHKLLFKNCI